MTLQVLFEERAIDQVAGYLHDDPTGVNSLFQVIDRLADEPRPPESSIYGHHDLRRLRIGRYRVLYVVRDPVVFVVHVSRGRGQV